MAKSKQPYTNGISDLFIFICLISLLVACSSCAVTKKDCRGVKHYKQSGGFYMQHECPECGQTDCIYKEIEDNVKGEGTDGEIEQAIQDVCKSRNISDTVTIGLLRENYYL